MRASGIELFFISYFFHRTHRKILIVDESIAFIGGVNFHQSAELWSDLVVRMKGKKIVRSILQSFAKSYANAGGTDAHILSIRKIQWRTLATWVVDHFPIAHAYKLKLLYQDRIRNAHTSITLVTPYFMPKRWLLSSLHQAVLRGVSVQILVPKCTDHSIIDRINYFYINTLSQTGVVFFLNEHMNHAKAMIVDSDEAIVGSQNIDFLSFNYNSEIGVFFKSATIITQLVKIIEMWKKDSRIFNYKDNKPRWYDYALSPFIKLFFRIL